MLLTSPGMIQESTAVSPRILIVRLSHLGDCVHALPLFHALRERHPRAEIGWVIQREFQSLVEGLPGLSACFAFEREGGLSGYGRSWSQLGAFGAEWAIDAQGNGKSAALLLASRAHRRTGRARSDWQEPFFSGVLTDSAAPQTGPHALDATRALVRHVAPGARWRTDLAILDEERAHAREWLHAQGAPTSPSLVLHLSRPSDIRAWPAEYCARLVELCRARGQSVLCVRGPQEATHFAELDARFAGDAGVLHWRERADLRRLAALLEVLRDSGAVFVGPDSGPIHLAAASGLRTLCLAGPQTHERTGPQPGRSLRRADGPVCAPCLQRECTHDSGPICMQISPQEVLAALEDRER